MEAEGPDPALALCGQKSTFTFLPGEASPEALAESSNFRENKTKL